ncbi:serine hydrolase domain-containing protein [Rhodococcus sp. NPDC003322]
MPGIDPTETMTHVRGILGRQPAVGFALGIVRDGSTEFLHTSGLADIAAHAPITEDTVFRIASITKTFTAIAILQLQEQGLVDLDAPADEYLRAYRLVPSKSGWRPATLRHLLTHTAGIGELAPRSGLLRRDFGESIAPGRPVPTLAEHYRGGVRLDAEPGTVFRYGDHGPATLGQIVEDVTGIPLHRYLREHVFAPLGMTDTTLLRSEVDPARLATGYTLGPDGARVVPFREWVTAGAANALSTPRDMGRYLAALLGGGSNEHGCVLQSATLASMFAPQYRPHPRIPGMGLAFFRKNPGGHAVIEHQGLLPGFDSQIVVAPEDGVAIMAFTNGTRQGGMWLPVEVGGLLGRLIDVPDDGIRTDVPQRPEFWNELCGWYQLPGSLTDTRVRSLMGAGFEVLVRRGRLTFRFLGPVPPLLRGLPLHPDDPADPYAFRLDLSEFGVGSFPVVFGRDPDSGVMAVHLEMMPLSAHRKPRTTNPRLWAEGAGAAAAAAVLGRVVSGRMRRAR